MLGGLEALAQLNHGVLIVKPSEIEIRGVSGNKSAAGEISRILSIRVGSKEIFKIKASYNKKFAPQLQIDLPKTCGQEINIVLSNSNIQFDPGKVIIKESSELAISSIANILRTCPKAKFEIQGHTDSSGSEELNKNLSQSRAEAVLFELLNQRVLTTGIIAKGYGSINPIADNNTEEGRKSNRRIEFKLIETLETKPGDQAS